MIPQQLIDALKKVFAFSDDKLKVTNPDLNFQNGGLKTSQTDDLLIRSDRTTSSDEFIASGMEFAFNNYTVSSGNETRLDGKLILKTLTVEGCIIINGVVEFD